MRLRWTWTAKCQKRAFRGSPEYCEVGRSGQCSQRGDADCFMVILCLTGPLYQGIKQLSLCIIVGGEGAALALRWTRQEFHRQELDL